MAVLTPPSLDDTQMIVELQYSASDTDLNDWCYPVLQKSPKSGLICKEGKPCIPQASTPLFIAQYHGVGHNSKATTLLLLKNNFYITEVDKLVAGFV